MLQDAEDPLLVLGGFDRADFHVADDATAIDAFTQEFCPVVLTDSLEVIRSLRSQQAERIPYVLPLAQVVSLIRGQGGLVYLPHPFDPGRSSLGEAAVSLCEAGSADIVEVFNAKIEDQARNDRAAKLAARYGLPAGAGSDAHDPDGIGAAFLQMPDFDGPGSFLASLREAVITGEYRPHAVRYPPRPR